MRLALALIALPSCTIDEKPARPLAEPPCGLEQETVQAFDAAYAPVLDLLVIVDDSPRMAARAERLAGELRGFGEALSQIWQGPSVHVGVVSASPSRAGIMIGAPPPGATCAGATDAYLRDEFPPGTCARERNFPGTLGDALACAGSLPPHSLETQQPLAALRRALSLDGLGAPFPNEGFWQHGTLGVVIIAAGDDESTEGAGLLDPAAVAEELATLTRSRALVAVIAPTDSPRLAAFAAHLGGSGDFIDLDAGDWQQALASTVRRVVGFHAEPRCIEAVLSDADATTPGLQADCAVTESFVTPGGERARRIMPPCGQGLFPCWSLQPSPSPCTLSGVRLLVDRVGCRPPAEAVLTVRCAT